MKYIAPRSIVINIDCEHSILELSNNLGIEEKGDTDDNNITEADTRVMSIWDYWVDK